MTWTQRLINFGIGGSTFGIIAIVCPPKLWMFLTMGLGAIVLFCFCCLFALWVTK